MAYLLNYICTKNYWNQTITVTIVIGGWVVYCLRHSVLIQKFMETVKKVTAAKQEKMHKGNVIINIVVTVTVIFKSGRNFL